MRWRLPLAALIAAPIAFGAGGLSAAAPGVPNQLAPLVIFAPPKDAPPSDATVLVGADQDTGSGQSISIWPAGALASRTNGWVTLACRVDVHGLAETCRVAYESPRGRGFGAAALALRPTLKVPPKRGADGPEDAMMNIAIAFKAPDPESNLSSLQAVTMYQAPDGGDKQSNLGQHELDARNLIVYQNPLATRRITMMDSTSWVQAPGFEALAAAYPAQGAGVEGYAVVHCRALPTGVLSRCAVARELPVGKGFGKAALMLAPQFQVSAEVMAQAPKGAPVEVDVPIRFPPPGEARDRTVRAPIWRTGFDPQSQMRDFPLATARPNSPGAVVRCTVGEDGGLTGCGVELTSPDGIDFDEAAVRLASRLKMNLWSAEAGPVKGGVVHLPVRIDMARASN